MSFFHSPKILAILLFWILMPEIKSASASVSSETILDGYYGGETIPEKGDPKFPKDWQVQSVRMCREGAEMLKNEKNYFEEDEDEKFDLDYPGLCNPESVVWVAMVKDGRVHYSITFGVNADNYREEFVNHICEYSQPFPIITFNPKLENCESNSGEM